MADVNINYGNIYNSIEFYKFKGFKEISAPWMVDLETINQTGIYDTNDMATLDTVNFSSTPVLVGSAEQSFLHLYKNSLLSTGKYIATTPCFRPTDNDPDNCRHKYFMKSELVDYTEDVNNCNDILNEMILSALENYKLLISEDVNGNSIEIKSITPEFENVLKQYDIELNGVEIGSYYIRHINELNLTYVCGTGIAEPRFSWALGLKL